MWYLFQTLNNSVYRSVDGDDDDDGDDELDDDEIDNAKDAMVKAAARRFLAVLTVWAAVYHEFHVPLDDGNGRVLDSPGEYCRAGGP